MATRTVYAVLEQHWIYDDQDWSMHLPDTPMKAYVSREQAEAALEAIERVASERSSVLPEDYDFEADDRDYYVEDADIRFSVVQVEVEDAE